MTEDPRHGMLVALVVGLVVLVLLLFAAFSVAPALVFMLCLMAYVVWWYISREDSSFMHHAQEHENRFWSLVAFCVSGALVFINDSPVAIGQWSPSLGFVLVAAFTFCIHSYDRQVHRSRIGRVPNISASIASSTMIHTTVQDKCRRISLCLSKLDNRLVATNVNHMIWADVVTNREKEIINILTDADTDELNYMLPKVKIGLLFYKIKDHPHKPHRSQLLNLLAVTRVADLNVTSRALVLDGLQQMKLSAHRMSEKYAKEIICKTKGDELSILKGLTDSKGDYNSLHKLVYQDIKDTSVREEVLKHIANQAAVQAAHMMLGTRTARGRRGKAWRKILSDVDDTLSCSGGHYPAGVDRRYPRKTIYPGVLDFYRELDLGTNGPNEWPKGQIGNLVFLSARPHVYKDMSEAQSYAKFQKLQDEKGLYTCPTLLAGSMDTGTAMLLTGDMEPVATKKFQNFAEYVALYPEFTHVFVGDNGQGDVRAAEMMADKFPNSLEAVYMHRVIPEEDTFGYKGPETREAWKKAKVFFFGDYIEASIHAYKNGLIQAVGLQRVSQSAVEQFVEDIWSMGRLEREGFLERELQRQQINRSVWKANKLLLAAGLEPIWLIRSIRAFEDGAAVVTPFGKGIVVNFREADGVYEIALDWTSGSGTKPGPSTKAPYRLSAASTSTHGMGTHGYSPSAIPSSTPTSSTSTPATPVKRKPPSTPTSGVGVGELTLAADSPLETPPSEGGVSQKKGRDSSDTLLRKGKGYGDGRDWEARMQQSKTDPEVMQDAQELRVAEETLEMEAERLRAAQANAEGEDRATSQGMSQAQQRGGPDAAAGGVCSPPVQAGALVHPGGVSRSVSMGAGAGAEIDRPTMAIRVYSAGAGLASGARVDGISEARVGAGGTSREEAMASGDGEGEGAGAGHVRMGAGAVMGPKETEKERPRSTSTEKSGEERLLEELHKSQYLSLTPTMGEPGGAESRNMSGVGISQGSGQSTGQAGAAFSSVAGGQASQKRAASVPVMGRHHGRGEEVDSLTRHLQGNPHHSPVDNVQLSTPSDKDGAESEDDLPDMTLAYGGGKMAPTSALLSAEGLEATGINDQAINDQSVPPTSALTPGATGKAFSPRAYLQLPSLRKAPEVKWRDSATDEDNRRRANRLSIFGGQSNPQETPPGPSSTAAAPTTFASSAAVAAAAAAETAAAAAEEARRPLPPGTEVKTFLGPAKTVCFRPGQDIYEVVFPWCDLYGTRPARGYLSRDGLDWEGRVEAEKRAEEAALAAATAAAEAGVGVGKSPSLLGRTGAALSSLFTLSSSSATAQAPTPSAAPAGPGAAGYSLAGAPAAVDLSAGERVQTIFGPAKVTGIRNLDGRSSKANTKAKDGQEGPTESIPNPNPKPSQRHTIAVVSDKRPTPTGTVESMVALQGQEDKANRKTISVTAQSGGGSMIKGLEQPALVSSVLATENAELMERRVSLYEVELLQWTLLNGHPIRAVLNRASLQREGEYNSGQGQGQSVVEGLGLGLGLAVERSRPPSSSVLGLFSRLGGTLSGTPNPNPKGGKGTVASGGLMRTPPPSPQRLSRVPRSPALPRPVFRCDFVLGSCVKTPYGLGLVKAFREDSGIYQVSLLNWRLEGDHCAKAFLTGASLKETAATPGQVVVTLFGLGRVEEIREDGGVVVAGLPSSTDTIQAKRRREGGQDSKMTLYLHLNMVKEKAKANVGDNVHTALGPGVVEAYRTASDTYTVDLGWGHLHTPHGSCIKRQIIATLESGGDQGSSRGGLLTFLRPLWGGGATVS
ncbi:unnamed protein product [Discosporangium mesarthrocarpum]